EGEPSPGVEHARPLPPVAVGALTASVERCLALRPHEGSVRGDHGWPPSDPAPRLSPWVGSLPPLPGAFSSSLAMSGERGCLAGVGSMTAWSAYNASKR